MKQLLAIALVHFNMLMGPQLLITVLSAGVWSTGRFLLQARQVSSRGLSKQSLNHTATVEEDTQGQL